LLHADRRTDGRTAMAKLTVAFRNKKKGKAIPLQACTDLEGSRKLRLPDFQTIIT